MKRLAYALFTATTTIINFLSDILRIISNIFDNAYILKFHPNTTKSTNITNFFILKHCASSVYNSWENTWPPKCNVDLPVLLIVWFAFEALKSSINPLIIVGMVHPMVDCENDAWFPSRVIARTDNSLCIVPVSKCTVLFIMLNCRAWIWKSYHCVNICTYYALTIEWKDVELNKKQICCIFVRTYT